MTDKIETINLLNYVREDFISESGKIKLPEGYNKIKIDIGLSYNAPNSSVWLERESDVVVFGFEPHPDTPKYLKGELQPPYQFANSLDKRHINDRFFLIPVALGATRRVSNFYKVIGGDLGTSSLYEPTSFSNEVTKVNVLRLDEFLKMIDWKSVPYIDQVKIDAQGEDYNIIKGIGEFINKIVFLTFETNTGNQYKETVNEYALISKYLLDNGFKEIHKGGYEATFVNINYRNNLQNINFFNEGL